MPVPTLPTLHDLGPEILRVPVWRRALALITPFVLCAAFFVAASRGHYVLALLCPVWGRIADRIGYAWVLGIGACALTIDILAFFQALDGIALAPGRLLWWSLSFSLFMSTAAVIPALCALVFPTQVRFTGFGFAYNGGALIAAAAPTVISWIILSYGKTAVVYYALVMGVLGVALALWAARLTYYPRPG